MFDFYPFISASLPVFTFIIIGIFLRRIDFIPDTGWQGIEKLSYYVLFPALLIHAIANVKYDIFEFLPMASALNIAALIMFFLSFLAWTDKTLVAPRFSSILQHNMRFNGFFAITIASQYHHGQFLSLVAIGVGLLIPTVNILSVWSLLIWGKASQKEEPVLSLLKNPLIIACCIGFALNYLGIGLNKNISSSLNMLGEASMPLSLMAIGKGIDFELLQQNPQSRLFWVFLRSVTYPLIVVFTCYLFGIRDIDIILAATIIVASPTATHSYILARQMGGDAPYMAGLIGTSTLVSIFTMPIMIYIIFLVLLI